MTGNARHRGRSSPITESAGPIVNFEGPRLSACFAHCGKAFRPTGSRREGAAKLANIGQAEEADSEDRGRVELTSDCGSGTKASTKWAPPNPVIARMMKSSSLPSLASRESASEQAARQALVAGLELKGKQLQGRRAVLRQAKQHGWRPMPFGADVEVAPALGPAALPPKREDLLLPRGTHHLLCNWSPAREPQMELLRQALSNLWGKDAAEPKTFYDLGCGDGRVVLKVCQDFPQCRGFGVDLNAKLIEQADVRARKGHLDDRCEFAAGDLADTKLSDADVVFMYLPPAALSFVLKRVFPNSGLRPGVFLFSADGPLPSSDCIIKPFKFRSICGLDKENLYCYTWQGMRPVNGISSATMNKRNSTKA